MSGKNVFSVVDEDFRDDQAVDNPSYDPEEGESSSPFAATFGDLVRDEQPGCDTLLAADNTLDAEFEETEELYQSAAQEVNPALILKENKEESVSPEIAALRGELLEILGQILEHTAATHAYTSDIYNDMSKLSKSLASFLRYRKSRTTGNPPGRPARKKPKLIVPPKKTRKPSVAKAAAGKKKAKPKRK